MDKTRVLMNNAGSQAADISKLLGEGGMETICLSASDNQAVRENADIFETEEELNDISSYVDYLLKKCREHKADVFIPFRRMVQLAEYREWFEEEGIRFMAPETDIFRLFNDKIQTYRFLEDIGGFDKIIPRYASLDSLVPTQGDDSRLNQFLDDMGDAEMFCVKKRSDISASSFKKISLDLWRMDSTIFDAKYKNTLPFYEFKRMMETKHTDGDLMAMEYLPGKEVSCDCLCSGRLKIVVPRIKLNPKTQLVTRSPELVRYCEDILELSGYNTPCNIQFRLEEGKPPKLLEINTRMSGGIYLASRASGINIPALAVKELLGEETNAEADFKEVKAVTKTDYYFF